MRIRQVGLITIVFLVGTVALAQSQLDNILSPARLPYLKNTKLQQVSSHDTSGRNDDFFPIPVGGTIQLANLKGPGVIAHIWVTISSPDKCFLRRLLLRMYWDGEKSPSVEVPIGDFFGTGFEYKQYFTPFVGMSSGGYYSYFPMPFNSSARIEVANETGQEVYSFYYHIDYHVLNEPLDTAIAYFHATWHRDIRTDPKKYYTLLEATGEGHLVGVNMSMQGYNRSMQFLEGDEMFYVDGEKKASLEGTGTEDYFNSGWYFNRGEFTAPYHGLILKDDSLGRIAAYRFHILDAVPFKHSIRALIEHGDQNVEVADYSSTAYWYQKEPHAPFAPMMPAGLRIPLRVQVPNGALEAESFTPSDTKSPFVTEDMSAYGADWSGLKQLKVEPTREGEGFTIILPALEDRYDVELFFTKGPGYGDVVVTYDGAEVGAFKGFDKSSIPGGKVSLANLRSHERKIALRFDVKGKDGRSSGYAVGLDAFTMKTHREYVPEWWVIGPFPNPRDQSLARLGLDTPYPPEKQIDLDATYKGVGGQNVGWKKLKTPPSGRFDLYMFDPYELVVVYALTYIYSPKDQTVPLLLGSDDGVKVFLNGKEIHRFLAVRIAEPDQDNVPLKLKRGWNTLMLKIENNFGGYNFYARVLDLEDSVRFSTTQRLE
jgi:hypothetical protein